MRFNNIVLYFATIIVINGLFIGVIYAQAVEPQALNLSGMPTVRPPVTSFSSEINQADAKSTANSLQVRQLEAAGLPTNRPTANITISEGGNVKIKNAVVFQIMGSTFFARTYWNESFIRWVIRTNDKTEVIKKFNGVAKYSDIAVGHELNIEGVLVQGSDALNVDVTTIRDLSLENESAVFSGKVTKVDSATSSFIIVTDTGKVLTVKTNGSPIIKKGLINIPLSKIVVGDKILSISGNYNQANETITVNNIEVYQEPSIFIPRNFQGKLKGLSGTTLPASFTIVLVDKEYTVIMSDKTELLTNKRASAKLQRFVEGDNIRVYGKIRENNLTTIDAEVVRNLDL